MKILLILTGKTNTDWIEEGINFYSTRVKRYITFDIKTLIPAKQSATAPQAYIKEKEAGQLLQLISADDYVVLLDENGTKKSSTDFADFIQKRMLTGNKRLVFVIGGAYGFGKELITRADYKISLSPMTFSHQIVRPLFMEQLYRAFSIINNEPYHHV